MRRLVTSARASLRWTEAERALDAPSARTLILAHSAAAAGDLFRAASLRHGGSFGWERSTLRELPAVLAGPLLSARRIAPASPTAIEAIAARAAARAGREATLGRFGTIAGFAGFASVLAETVEEVRLARVDVDRLPTDLAALVRAFEAELAAARVADRRALLDLATEALASGAHPWARMVWLDLSVHSSAEAAFLGALAAAGGAVLATAPTTDLRSVAALAGVLGSVPDELPTETETALGRLQRRLFAEEAVLGAPGPEVEIFSAPSEEREAAEICRRILRAAGDGIRFDQIAVFVRGARAYRLPLQAAFEAAQIPVWWAQGAQAPDPVGRAFLALLACRAEGLSARRFAEYLSLGETPDDATAPRLPFRWERLLVEAAVIGGLARWRRRLDALERRLETSASDPTREPAAAERDRASVDQVRSLRTFALPLLEAMAAWPETARWDEWLPALAALAERALREPQRVLRLVHELRVLGPVGPVGLDEVVRVLGPSLVELGGAPPARRYGAVFVGPIDAARGLVFDRVFVAGVGEKMLPYQVTEDPLLLDPDRRALGLPTRDDRAADERLLFQIAVGAARDAVGLSWPRMEVAPVRARPPSVFLLDAVRAVEGAGGSWDRLAERARAAGAARIDWPAPIDPADAIDATEFDLAFLRALRGRPEVEIRGAARWMVDDNPHLHRALRRQWARWDRKWRAWDGLSGAGVPEVVRALAERDPAIYPWAATALEGFADCRYRFYLRSVARLAPPDAPDELHHLDPLSRGTIVHESLWRLLTELRDEGRVPLGAAGLAHARERLDVHLGAVVDRHRDDRPPVLDVVFAEDVARIRADLRVWLARAAAEGGWSPWRLELAFGLPAHARADRASVPDALPLPIGLRLRGSIDLIERRADGVLRVTDYKTGRVRAPAARGTSGGSVLQPLLYLLACEALFPGEPLDTARLWHLTAAARFAVESYALSPSAREEVRQVVAEIRRAFATATFRPTPSRGQCARCEFRPVCGSDEERRVARKEAA